jgi:hypothetical protein
MNTPKKNGEGKKKGNNKGVLLATHVKKENTCHPLRQPMKKEITKKKKYVFALLTIA